MSTIQLVIVSLIQGITEFLPISSSGHLMLLPLLTGWHDQGITMDMAAHMGTFCAVMLYFRKDVVNFIYEIKELVTLRKYPKELVLIVVATIPTIVVGGLWSGRGVEMGPSLFIIGLASLIFGAAMGYVDRVQPEKFKRDQMTVLQAFLIGCAQVCALIPGASRSGTTVSMARILGFARDEAFHFSFLMSLPVTAAAGILIFFKAKKFGEVLFTPHFILVASLSAIIGLVAISVIMPLFKRISLLPFALYRVVLGILLIGVSLYI